MQNIEYFLNEEINAKTNSEIPLCIKNPSIFHSIVDIEPFIVTVSLTGIPVVCSVNIGFFFHLSAPMFLTNKE